MIRGGGCTDCFERPRHLRMTLALTRLVASIALVPLRSGSKVAEQRRLQLWASPAPFAIVTRGWTEPMVAVALLAPPTVGPRRRRVAPNGRCASRLIGSCSCSWSVRSLRVLAIRKRGPRKGSRGVSGPEQAHCLAVEAAADEVERGTPHTS